MTPNACRRLSAFLVASLLVVGLAACAGAEPEAMPTLEPTPTPSETETVAAPTPPGSRVPVDCTQIFAGLDGFAVSSSLVRDQGSRYAAQLAQAGFMHCEVDGQLGGTDVSTQVVVGVEIPRETIASWVPSAISNGDVETMSADIAFSNCTADRVVGYCTANAFANGYLVQYSIGAVGPVAPDFDAAYAGFDASLGARISSWEAPPPAWQAPAGALVWSSDCDDVASAGAAVRAAFPFSVDYVENPSAGGDGFWLTYEVKRRVVATQCLWSGPSGTVYVDISPGSAWYFEQPGALEGEPYEYPGALATITSEQTLVRLQVVVDGSLVSVSVSDYSASLSEDTLASSARAIVDAIIAELSP